MVKVLHMTKSPELIEDMGEWENVNCYDHNLFTLNKWSETGFHARLVSLKKDEVLVIK